MSGTYITSEDDFLALIAAIFPNEHRSLALGRGDDCAEIVCPARMAVSTDLFVEDVHFRRSYFSPAQVGYKALAVNISDMAAAGARPLGVSVGLVTPVPFPRVEAKGILEGMLKAASEHTIALTGGDLSRGEKLAFCVTIWGESGSFQNMEPHFLRRGPVSPGDTLFLCGHVGLARAGLFLLEDHGSEAVTRFPAACEAHLTPTPLVSSGLALATVPNCRLMDLSDGLARDLPRMLSAHGAKCGATITLPHNALHHEVITYADSISEDPIRFAFLGGEDYALLGACPASYISNVSECIRNADASLPFRVLGTVTASPGIVLNGISLNNRGFDHFG